ncbi:hypothetical protein RB195_003103 [Necator americanus]|uniref:Uncharacterized protein n=1 Tax=Necator americanus TaxID=51031 RepID=A0ABR1DM18_NECAM
MERMDSSFEELGRLRFKVVGNPELDFFAGCELSLGQGVLHRSEQMVIGWCQVWAVWRMRQDFPAQFLNFFQSDFRDMRTSVVVEEFCRRRFDTLTTQCLIHAVQVIFVHVRRNCLTRIQNFKVHQTFAVPPNTEHHLFAVYIGVGFGVPPASNHCLRVALSKEIHLSSDVTTESKKPLFLERRRRVPAIATRAALFASLSWCGTHFPHLFVLPIASKCSWMVEFEQPKCVASSRVVWRGSNSTTDFNTWSSKT